MVERSHFEFSSDFQRRLDSAEIAAKVAGERTGCSGRIEQCVWYPEKERVA